MYVVRGGRVKAVAVTRATSRKTVRRQLRTAGLLH
jgi:hypothetical protein